MSLSAIEDKKYSTYAPLFEKTENYDFLNIVKADIINWSDKKIRKAVYKVFSQYKYKYVKFHKCITINQCVKDDGRAVMGKGIALDAAKKYNGLSKILGGLIETVKTNLYILPNNLLGFVTKDDWRYSSNHYIITQSYLALLDLAYNLNNINGSVKFLLDKGNKAWHVFLLPTPGCNNGGLKWDGVGNVKELLRINTSTWSNKLLYNNFNNRDWLRWNLGNNRFFVIFVERPK